jgi:hypothetical protein
VPQPPRRRLTDRNASSLERQLDLVSERVDDLADRFAAIDRRVSEVRNDMLESRRESNGRFDRLEEKVDDSFARNFREHHNVQTTADKIAANVEPTRWSKVKDYATFISVLIVPFLLTYLTIVLVKGKP